MNDIMLTKYSVKGIKNLENEITLSFYKKTISDPVNSKGYNVKAVYGENGAGKTALISSAAILKSVLLNPGYLNDSHVQSELTKLVNKKTGILAYDVEFLVHTEGAKKIYRYRLDIRKGPQENYEIETEQLSYRKAESHSGVEKGIYSVYNGELSSINTNKELEKSIIEKTKNLLQSGSLAALYVKNYIFLDMDIQNSNAIQEDLLWVYLFGCSIVVYLGVEDDSMFLFRNSTGDDTSDPLNFKRCETIRRILMKENYQKDRDICGLIPQTMKVPREYYEWFREQVDELYEFIRLFKNQLNSIVVDKREDGAYYRCNLLMNYDGYSVDAEYESTGIKKLINIYSHIKTASYGDIVFVDELDSSLHDVYLCALLEYLMEYGKGQLCFTTHSIGQMEILKKNKKSIDFLSTNQQIYSWTTNGNYSPSKLYREGMIAGSPFNVDPIDFVTVFGNPRGE